MRSFRELENTINENGPVLTFINGIHHYDSCLQFANVFTEQFPQRPEIPRFRAATPAAALSECLDQGGIIWIEAVK
jgi:hypothetical protein